MAQLQIPGYVKPVIDYFEVPSSPREQYSFSSGGKVQRTFLTAWDDRWHFCRGMLGWSEIKKDASGRKYLSRQIPKGYEGIVSGGPMGDDIDRKWLFPVSVDSIEPVAARGKDTKDIFKYEKAKITISYEGLLYRVLADDDPTLPRDQNGNPDESSLRRFITRHIQPNSEYLTLPFGQFKYTSDKVHATQGAGMIISTAEIQYTWHQVPFIPNAVYTHIGKTNKDTFLDRSVALNPSVDSGTLFTGNYGFPPETLLLTSAEIKSYRQIGGLFVCDIVYRMKYFAAVNPTTGEQYNPARGHNYIIRHKKGVNPDQPGSTSTDNYYVYELITTNGSNTGNKIYTPVDFTALFKPA